MGGMVKIDVFAFDPAANVFDASPSIVGDIHNGSEGVVARVGRNRSPVGFGAGGSDADGLGLALAGAIGHDGFKAVVPLPAAALAALAIAGRFHVDDLRLLVPRNPILPPRRAPA